MAILTIEQIPDEVFDALRVRATASGRSMEAEVREILQTAVAPPKRVTLGSLLKEVGQEAQFTDEEAGTFEGLRDKSPPRMIDFE